MARENTTYGRRKLSAAAYQAQAARKKVTSASGNVYGRRKAAGSRTGRASTVATAAAAGASLVLAELIEGLHVNSVAWAKERILQLQTPEEVRAVHAFERTHPQHHGGRKGVLNACEERLGELKVESPSEGLARMPAAPAAQDEAAPDGEPPAGEPRPFDGEALLEVDEMRAILEEQPELLDAAIEAEFRAGAPRAEAIALFLEREQVRAGGPREEVVHLLSQF